jgi:sugar lactone lactonase YvrE
MDCCGAWGAIEIQPGGSILGANGKELVILDSQGKRRNSFPEPAYAWEITWNRQSNRFASLTDLNNEDTVLRYWPFGSTRFTPSETISRAHKQASPTTITWSNDGEAVSYSRDGKVWIFTLEGGKSISIGDGTMPSWSPDGKWIAYRDPAGHIALVKPRDRVRHAVMPDSVIARGVRWSPDSAFLLVTINRPHMDFYEQTEFVIYRLADGASIRVNPLIGGTDENRVFWVVKSGDSHQPARSIK